MGWMLSKALKKQSIDDRIIHKSIETILEHIKLLYCFFTVPLDYRSYDVFVLWQNARFKTQMEK